jgi:peroxiredoxin Q/BCP
LKAQALRVGAKAPDFTLPRDGGGTVSLSDLRGGPVVLFFYPKANTPGCTTEARDFTALLPDFTAAGATVLGISKDSVKKQENFVAKQGLAMPILSDAEGEVCEVYGVWGEKSMYGHRAHNRPDRRRWQHRAGLGQGEGRGPRGRGARGGARALTPNMPETGQMFELCWRPAEACRNRRKLATCGNPTLKNPAKNIALATRSR